MEYGKYLIPVGCLLVLPMSASVAFADDLFLKKGVQVAQVQSAPTPRTQLPKILQPDQLSPSVQEPSPSGPKRDLSLVFETSKKEQELQAQEARLLDAVRVDPPAQEVVTEPSAISKTIPAEKKNVALPPPNPIASLPSNIKIDVPKNKSPDNAPVIKVAVKSSKETQEIPSSGAVTKKVDTKKVVNVAKAGTSQNSSAILALQKSNSELRAAVTEAQRRGDQLARELDETRRRLILAESQVERLSGYAENRGDVSRIPSVATRNGIVDDHTTVRSSFGESPLIDAPVPAPVGVDNDMPFASIAIDGAEVRTGPGVGNSILLRLPQGTTVPVAKRSGDWFQIITPSGARGFVTSASVTLARPLSPQRNSGAPSRGATAHTTTEAEDKAFELIRQGARN